MGNTITDVDCTFVDCSSPFKPLSTVSIATMVINIIITLGILILALLTIPVLAIFIVYIIENKKVSGIKSLFSRKIVKTYFIILFSLATVWGVKLVMLHFTA